MRKRDWVSSRIRYSFDNSLARGPIALVGWLALISGSAVALLSVFLWIFELAPLGISPTREDGSLPGLIDIFWIELLRVLDPGTMGEDSGRWPFLLTMLATTLIGIFAVSVLIGLVTSAIDAKIDELHRGQSRVLESNHTLILGWSPQIFEVVREISLADQNQRRSRIVILANQDLRLMTRELRRRVRLTGRTRVICRTGSSIDPDDLRIVSPEKARSIIVLKPEVQNPDAYVIKTILALTRIIGESGSVKHIIADVDEAIDISAANLIGKSHVSLLLTRDMISSIIVQASRQSGLSEVFRELLSFHGQEIYIIPAGKTAGSTFGESLFAFPDACLIGTVSGGTHQLNPPSETVITEADQLILVAEDDDRVQVAERIDGSRFMPETLVDPQAIGDPVVAPRQPNRTLILGWNDRIRAIVTGLHDLSSPGSLVKIVSRYAGSVAEEELPSDLERITVDYQRGDIAQRRTLEALALETYDQIIVLPYARDLEPQAADAISLITLLNVREMLQRVETPPRIVTEMLDMGNGQLAEATGADDFIVSSHLTSLAVAQVSQNPRLSDVFTELLCPAGNEIFLREPGAYGLNGAEINFATAVEAARRVGHVAFGYRMRIPGPTREQAWRIILNPPKSERISLREGDRIVVIAQD